MTTNKSSGFIPPVGGLSAPQLKPIPHPTRDALGLIGYIPEQDQRKPKPVENHWKPEDDLPPEVLKAFEKKEKRK